jgi:outer membrane protein OmpA-like peptidoglycan-associated protein
MLKTPFAFLLFFITLPCILFAQGSDPVVLISGKVVNERTMEAVEARVIYEILPEGTEAGIARSDPWSGEYKIILPRGKQYGYRGYAEGYYCVSKNCDVTELEKYTEIEEQNLYMAPLLVDQVIRLNNIFFKGRSAEFKSESNPELNRFVEFMKVNKKLIIELQGHTDNKGEAAENLTLSENRAKAVADYLISKGIKADRIQIKGFGQTRPIAFNKDEEGREMNRRIEFKVISTGIK